MPLYTFEDTLPATPDLMTYFTDYFTYEVNHISGRFAASYWNIVTEVYAADGRVSWDVGIAHFSIHVNIMPRNFET